MAFNLGFDIGGAVGGALSGVFGLIGNKQSYNAQTQLMQNQYEYNTWLQQQGADIQRGLNEQQAALEMSNWFSSFNAQNEYNNPVNSIKRLYDAGINPLFNGMDSSSSMGAAGAAAGGSALGGSVGLPQAPDYGQTLQNAFGQMLEKQRIDIMKTRADHQNKVDDAQADSITAQTIINKDMAPENKKLIIAKIAQAYADGDLSVAKSAEAQQNIKYMVDEIGLRTNELNLKVQEFNRQYTEMILDYAKHMDNLQVSMMGAVTDRMNAETNWFNAKVGEYDAQTRRMSHNETVRKNWQDYNLALKGYQLDVQKMNLSALTDILDKSRISPFGVNIGVNKNFLTNATAMVNAYTGVLDKADSADKARIIDTFEDGISRLVEYLGAFMLMKAFGRGVGSKVGKTMNKPVPQVPPYNGQPMPPDVFDATNGPYGY